MVRLTGFSSPRLHFTPQDGTFGTHVKDIPVIIEWLVERQQRFDFKGFHFMSMMSTSSKTGGDRKRTGTHFSGYSNGLKPKGLILA